ncbi:MAG: serine hydrolase domain-containing protein [Bacteroidota bacterium]
MKHPRISRQLIPLIVFTTLVSFVQANNGHLVIAYPMDTVSIDGDLSDWPSDIEVHPINYFLFGQERSGGEDIRAQLKIGYNQASQMLFVGVEVWDDAITGDKSDTAEWNTHDIHNFYIDPTHDARGSSVISHLLSLDFNRIAENKPHDSWDPQVQNAKWDPVKVIITSNGNKTIYEWSYFLGKQLKVGKTLGFEYEVIDKDPGEEGFPTVLAWSPGQGKAFNTGNVGDILLMEDPSALGTLKGQVKWKAMDSLNIPPRIHIQSLDQPDLWTIGLVDSLGNYSFTLPAGDYKVSIPFPMYYQNYKGYRLDLGRGIRTRIEKGNTVTASTLEIELLPQPNILPEEGILFNFSSQDKQRVDEFMKAYMAYYDVPGASLSLVKEGMVAYYKTYGYQNAYTQEAVNQHTLFEAASVTKPVFAFAVNRLVERGEFDLDKPLHEYLPFEQIAEDERYKKMTGRHVLTHVSGLPNWGMHLEREPGIEFGYSGEGFEYLKRVVCHVTGRKIDEILTTEVLHPMGISHTHFHRNEELVEVASHGHNGSLPTIIQMPSETYVASSMQTEALKFSHFMISLLERKGLKPETYKEMFRPQTPIPEDYYTPGLSTKEDFGLGIMVFDTHWGKAYGHGGNNGDFRCQFEIFDEGKMGFALFTNGSNGHLLVQALREFLITGKVEQ